MKIGAATHDCPAESGNPGQCVTLPSGEKQCCAIVEGLDLLAVLDAYGERYACPHKCPPGACDFDTNADTTPDCCIDGRYFPNGMSEACCFTKGGTYHGNGTSCTLPACSPFASCP